MDDRFDMLLDIVEKSVEKNGSIPLTTGHLLNILKLVQREYERVTDDEYAITKSLDCEIEW
jgi:hypothetical protein